MEENIECHERIARFHILSLYELGEVEEGDFFQQEKEQLNKSELDYLFPIQVKRSMGDGLI